MSVVKPAQKDMDEASGGLHTAHNVLEDAACSIHKEQCSSKACSQKSSHANKVNDHLAAQCLVLCSMHHVCILEMLVAVTFL